MAEILQTVKEIEKFFAGLFVEYAGVNKNKVLLAYSEEGRPAFNIDKMAYFISVFPEVDDRESYKHREEKYIDSIGKFRQSQFSQRTLRLHITTYGENTDQSIIRFQNMLYSADANYTLSNMYLHIIPERTNGVIRLQERINDRWWTRYDIDLYFYNTVKIENDVSAFESVDIRTEVNN